MLLRVHALLPLRQKAEHSALRALITAEEHIPVVYRRGMEQIARALLLGRAQKAGVHGDAAVSALLVPIEHVGEENAFLTAARRAVE